MKLEQFDASPIKKTNLQSSRICTISNLSIDGAPLSINSFMQHFSSNCVYPPVFVNSSYSDFHSFYV